jgi:hypothetical protein
VKYGYGPVFAICSVLYLIAFAAVHFLIGELGVIRKLPGLAAPSAPTIKPG